MDQIQSFSSDSGGVLVPLGTKVRGNVQVIIHHIRAIPIGRKANLVSLYSLCLLCEFLVPFSSFLLFKDMMLYYTHEFGYTVGLLLFVFLFLYRCCFMSIQYILCLMNA